MSECMNQIGRLSKRLAAAEDRIERQRVVIDDLRDENDRLERILQSPLSVKDLEAAWDAAEVPTDDAPIREGDTLIFRGQQGDVAVFEQAGVFLKRHIHGARILSRAPKREPWADLADILLEDGLAFEEDVEGIVKRLHERGVRVTGGEES